MQNIPKTQMQTEDLENLDKTYIPKIKSVLQSMGISEKEKEDRITRILNVYLKENVDYKWAVEKICYRVKEAQRLWEKRDEDCYLERDLKNVLRKFLFELIKVRGFMRGKSFHVYIKERKPHEKKLILKCQDWEVPREYMKLVPDRDKIKRMLDKEGPKDWVEYDPDTEFSLWICKPNNRYIPYKYR